MHSISRRQFHYLLLASGAITALGSYRLDAEQENPPSTFAHPGMLHSREDFLRMKHDVARKQEPLFSGFEVFRKHPQSQASYRMKGPFEEVGRNPTIHIDAFDSDANAAYQCAVMWSITGDSAYAEVSRSILNGWAASLKVIDGADAVLAAGLGGFKLLNAAELIRHTYPKIGPKEVTAWQKLFLTVLMPVLEHFAPFANGNWDTAAVKTVMAIGIFCDDSSIFERGLMYYLYGCGDGRITHYIYEDGQCQESGRDQQHTQLGLGHLGDCCEMAWQQGIDLYAAYDNLLLKGIEYTAGYNTGQDLPFHPDRDRTGKYFHPANSPRGSLRPIYEQIYNHYVRRKGMRAPFTERAAAKIRPEGAAQGADHPGFGTLFFSRSSSKVDNASSKPARIGGLKAVGFAEEVALCWEPRVPATEYRILRAEKREGPFRPVAEALVDHRWKDRSVVASSQYFYRVMAENRDTQSATVGAVAGLPKKWQQASIGLHSMPGNCVSDGESLQIEAAGSSVLDLKDQFHFVHQTLKQDFSLQARILPCIASQKVFMGLMSRTGTEEDAPQLSVVLTPQTAGISERPQWSVVVGVRRKPGTGVETAASASLNMPLVTYGRLKKPIWLKLVREGNRFHAFYSSDGSTWTPAIRDFAFEQPEALLAGVFVCSGLGDISTEVAFDHCGVSSS